MSLAANIACSERTTSSLGSGHAETIHALHKVADTLADHRPTPSSTRGSTNAVGIPTIIVAFNATGPRTSFRFVYDVNTALRTYSA